VKVARRRATDGPAGSVDGATADGTLDADRAAFAAEPPSGIAVEAPSDLAISTGTPVLADATVHLAPELLQELIDCARDGLPNEACGIIVGDRFARDGGVAVGFEPLRNAADSPYRYLIAPEEQLGIMTRIDDAGQVVWGIFHSHVASPAEPSRTDVELAFYPGSLYLICSLADDGPVVRAWTIEGGDAHEVALEVG
jgi:proteasome lid subunit RPN8/RPN11